MCKPRDAGGRAAQPRLGEKRVCADRALASDHSGRARMRHLAGAWRPPVHLGYDPGVPQLVEGLTVHERHAGSNPAPGVQDKTKARLTAGLRVPQDGDSLSTRSVARTRGLRSVSYGAYRDRTGDLRLAKHDRPLVHPVTPSFSRHHVATYSRMLRLSLTRLLTRFEVRSL